MSNLSTSRPISPSASIDSLNAGHEPESSRPQSVWSDSDNSDSQTKRWVAKGSKMLRKQNSRFNLSSSRMVDWLEEDDETNEQYHERQPRSHLKHGRMSSTGNDLPSRPRISHPYNFRHLTHTQANHFSDIPGASEDQLHTQFSAVRASQSPQRKLRGIRAEELRSPLSDPASTDSKGPVTPPMQSPVKSRVSRPSNDVAARVVNSSEIGFECLSDQSVGDQDLPHAITTSDDVALTLMPPSLRRSTLALADVPEEDELHAVKLASIETSRPKTADANLRHAKSFPTNSRLTHGTKTSRSRKANQRPDSIFVEGPAFLDSTLRQLVTDSADDHVHRVTSPRTSLRPNGIDAGWEDDIDFCYQHEAEADCDFDWDRVSISNLPSNEKLNQAHDNTVESLRQSREETTPQGGATDAINHGSDCRTDKQHLPRLQTSLPDLDFSAASSAKSSMASLRGPMTPLLSLPSPEKTKPSLPSWNNLDMLNLDSSLYVPQTDSISWNQEEEFQKVSSWNRAPNSNHYSSNLSLASNSNDTSHRNAISALHACHSSESVVSSRSTSAIQTRRNTSSSGSLPELICSKNYRQYAKATADQIAERIAALSVTESIAHARESIPPSKPTATRAKSAGPQSILKKPSPDSVRLPTTSQETDESPLSSQPTKSSDQPASVGSFAQRLRTNSIASSSSGASSTRMSRVSYSLFPAVPPARSFSTSSKRQEVLDIATLPSRRVPSYQETRQNDLLSLRWPLPPQNVLLVQKKMAPLATEALMDHIRETYPNINILLEPEAAASLHQSIPFPVYALPSTKNSAHGNPGVLAQKVDLTATFGGDGTILRASSLFSAAHSVPPILSFSMGTLGFLGEWKFAEFKRAFREVYMSGAGAGDRSQILGPDSTAVHNLTRARNNQKVALDASLGDTGWSSIRGKSLGSTRGARVLLRHRLKVSVSASSQDADIADLSSSDTIHAMNELIIHRGATPHLAHIAIHINNRFLTEAYRVLPLFGRQYHPSVGRFLVLDADLSAQLEFPATGVASEDGGDASTE
ncbi:MAG: hypothetical protein LQ352_007404 [Teloschistes flavicans]|nr:MAG: hypothetical protein LQ352_007404 [Teloschistes flavicans]